MNYLFYSNKCPYSMHIIKLLTSNNIIGNFKLIDVNKHEIPQNIKSVPTLIIKDIIKPLVGKEALNWVKMQDYVNIITYNSTINIHNNKLNNEIYLPTKIIDSKYIYIDDKQDNNINKGCDITKTQKIIEVIDEGEKKITNNEQDILLTKEIESRNTQLQILLYNMSK